MDNGLPSARNSLFLIADKDRKEPEVSPQAIRAKTRAAPNLALYDDRDLPHPVLAHVIKLAQQAYSAYNDQRSAMQERWDLADDMYWMEQKEHRMPELTLAKVSSSIFHQATRRLTDGAYVATYSDPDGMPVKFMPQINVFEPSDSKQRKALIAQGLNRVALQSMRKTHFREKAYKSYYRIYKYANHIAYVPYDFQIEKRKRWQTIDPNEVVAGGEAPIFRHKLTGEESLMPHEPVAHEVEYDQIIKDEVGFYPLNIEDCWLDDRIEDLNRQTVFLQRSDITRPEIWAEARAGKFQNVRFITDLQQFQLYGNDQQIYNERKQNAEKITTDSIYSEVYERWKCWMLLPRIKVTQNKKGDVTDLKWDQNGEERRYLVEGIGNLNDKMVTVRFCESPYWSNGIPYIDAHSHNDDSGFYVRGMTEILDDNMLQEQVAKGQLMDNRTLMNRRPLIRMMGRVKNKDCKIGFNTVFDVSERGALEQMQMTDLTGNIKATLDYLRDDSEKLAQTPKFFLGEAAGSRTSATEFSSLRDQGSAPAMNDIAVLNMQLAGGYFRKIKEYAPQFLDKNVFVEDATGQPVEISPDEFEMDMMIQEVSVQSFDNRQTTRQIFINMVSGVLNSPMFAGIANPVGVFEKLFSMFPEITPNPEELLIKNDVTKQLLIEYQQQKAAEQKAAVNPGQGGAQPQQGEPPNPFVQALTAGRAEAQPIQAAMGAAGGV